MRNETLLRLRELVTVMPWLCSKNTTFESLTTAQLGKILRRIINHLLIKWIQLESIILMHWPLPCMWYRNLDDHIFSRRAFCLCLILISSQLFFNILVTDNMQTNQSRIVINHLRNNKHNKGASEKYIPGDIIYSFSWFQSWPAFLLYCTSSRAFVLPAHLAPDALALIYALWY